MFNSTDENPTSIPPTDHNRFRARDNFSRVDDIVICRTRDDRRCFIALVKTQRTAKNKRQKVSGYMEKLLRYLCVLQDPCDDTDWQTDHCPAHNKLSAKTGISVSQIKELLIRAEELRFVDVGERYRSQVSGERGAKQTTNRYTLLLPDPDQIGEWRSDDERRAIKTASKVAVGIDHSSVDNDQMLVSNSESACYRQAVQAVKCGQQVDGWSCPPWWCKSGG